MRLQYLSDYSGKHTAVVIPIAEWKALVQKHADLQLLENEAGNKRSVPAKYTMADFMGTISSETADALLNHIDQSRNEWDRNS